MSQVLPPAAKTYQIIFFPIQIFSSRCEQMIFPNEIVPIQTSWNWATLVKVKTMKLSDHLGSFG